MALCGVASRRKSEELILDGLVKVNDNLIMEMGYMVDENIDVVKVNDVIISTEETKHYYAFNKPSGVITSANDEKGRKCVLDYFSDVDVRLFTVGRLDYASSGLILVTNDGEFANRVTHPKYECAKTYDAHVSGHISKDQLAKLKTGIVIDGYKTSPASIQLTQLGPNAQFLKISIKEGRNRQIRKMVELAGAQVKTLERTAVGCVSLGELKIGEYRMLSQGEIQYFYSLEQKQKNKGLF